MIAGFGTTNIAPGRFYAACLASAICLLPLMLSSDSLWIDEAYTAQMARLPTFASLAHDFHVGTDSHHQMPLGMGVAWIAARLLGTSEVALRAPNMVWAAVAVIAMSKIGRRIGAPYLPLLIALHPFVWRYVNEARPYAMQIAGSALCCFSLVSLLQGTSAKATWARAFAAGSVLLAGSSLLGMIPVSCIAVTLAYLIIDARHPVSREATVYLRFTAVILVILSWFYAWTLYKGAGGTRVWPVNISNVLFALYELGGFAGLGPSRLRLRDAASESTIASLQTILPYALPIALLLALYAYLLGNWWRSEVSWQERRVVFAAAAIAALTIAVMLMLGYAVRWPFWGRHLAAVLPFQLLIIGSCIAAAKSKLGRAVSATFCAILLVSALELRFNREHMRDDYRTAAAMAHTAATTGQTVWWCADDEAAHYYRVELSQTATRAAAISVENRTADELRLIGEQAPPDLIIYTRPNACDRYGAVAAFVQQHRWTAAGTAPAFTFYEPPK